MSLLSRFIGIRPATGLSYAVSILLAAAPVLARGLLVKPTYKTGDFPLVYGGKAVDILVFAEDSKLQPVAAASACHVVR